MLNNDRGICNELPKVIELQTTIALQVGEEGVIRVVVRICTYQSQDEGIWWSMVSPYILDVSPTAASSTRPFAGGFHSDLSTSPASGVAGHSQWCHVASPHMSLC